MTRTTTDATGPRAVPVTEPAPDGDRPDYADAFEIQLRRPDARTAEEWVRRGLEQAPPPVRWTVATVHRRVLRFPLDLRPSPRRVLGWPIVAAGPDAIVLETGSPLLRAVIVGRRSDPSRTVLTTFVYYRHRRLAAAVWAVVAPLHRAVAPRLLARAAGGGRGVRKPAR